MESERLLSKEERARWQKKIFKHRNNLSKNCQSEYFIHHYRSFLAQKIKGKMLKFLKYLVLNKRLNRKKSQILEFV